LRKYESQNIPPFAGPEARNVHFDVKNVFGLVSFAINFATFLQKLEQVFCKNKNLILTQYF